MNTLRFLVFNLIAWCSCVLWALVVLLVAPWSNSAAYAVARNWCIVISHLVRVLCGLRFRVEGLENFPAEANVIFIKHSSAFETFIQLIAFPRNCWVLKRELMWVPFFGWALRPLRAIAINRGAGGAAVRQVIEQGKLRLAAGINVAIFPEGTRMPAGTTRRYGMSGTLLAQEAGCKIVPVAHNAGYHWPRGGFSIRPGEVSFVVGKPVDPAGRDAREVNDEIQTWMEATGRDIVARHPASKA